MGQPRDAIALAASSGVPDEVVLAGAGDACVGYEFANCIDLVVSGEYQSFLFLT